jgi:hypothetical protein
MRLGLGIRPSSTISSNFVTPTPIYLALCARERPRGASDGGKQLRSLSVILFGTGRASLSMQTSERRMAVMPGGSRIVFRTLGQSKNHDSSAEFGVPARFNHTMIGGGAHNKGNPQ